MNIFTLVDQGNGTSNAVIRCKGGHVHLRGLKERDYTQHERLFRLFADAQEQLPPNMDNVVSFLDGMAHLERDDFNDPHIGYRPVAELTPEAVDAAFEIPQSDEGQTEKRKGKGKKLKGEDVPMDGVPREAALEGGGNPNGTQLPTDSEPPNPEPVKTPTPETPQSDEGQAPAPSA